MKKIIPVIVLAAFFLIGIFYYRPNKYQIQYLDIPYVKAIYSKPVTYDPAQMNDVASLIFSELVYEGLLRFTKDYGVKPGIAKSWETSKDGKTIIFTLDENATFHNGDKIVSDDVVISLNRILSPKSKVYKYYDMILGSSKYHHGESKSVSGIKAIDPHTVMIKLKDSFPPILYILAGGTAKIFPARLIKNKDFFKNPIASGPFIVSQIGEVNISLKRFEKYHGDRPKIKSLILRAIAQGAAMKEAKEGKLHDLSSWPLSGMEDVFNSGQNISTVLADTWIIGFNTRITPLNNLKVRKAFKESIDTEKFRTMFYPNAVSAYGYVPPGFPGHVEKEVKTEEISIPEHSTITITIPKELDKVKEMAIFLKKDLRAKGWKVKTEVMGWAKMMKKYQEKTLQSFLISMNMDYPDSEFLLNNFSSHNPDNYSGVKDPLIDSWLNEARQLQDRIKRLKVYEKVAHRVNGLALSANLFHSKPHYWIHECVRNFEPNLLATAYIDYRKVSLDGTCLTGSKK